MLRFSFPGLVSIVFTLAACSHGSAPPSAARTNAPSPGGTLSQVTEGYWEESLKRQPREIPSSPVARFDPAAGYDISAQFLADSLDLERRYREALSAVPRTSLNAESQLTYDIFERERDLAIESFTYPFELMPVNPFRSVPLEFARAGAGVGAYAILGVKDYDSWRARADAYGRWTLQATQNMREGLRRGYSLPRVLVERMLPMLAALGADIPSNVFYRPLAAFPPSIREGDRRRFAAGITAGVKQILPAYRELHDFLRDEYLPRARQSVGLSALPLGASWYAFLVRRETASRLAPADIAAIGTAETERLRGRLQSLLAESGFAGDAQAFFEAVQRAPRATYQTPEESSASMRSSRSRSRGDFALVRGGAADRFSHSTRGSVPCRPYPGALLERARTVHRTVLYVDTTSQPLIPRTAAFLREALPDITCSSLSRRSDPACRHSAGSAAIRVSWKDRGLYAESLGEELGLYRDTEAKFDSLRDQLACAAALVADTGLHALGWSPRASARLLARPGPRRRRGGERGDRSHDRPARRGARLRVGSTSCAASRRTRSRCSARISTCETFTPS